LAASGLGGGAENNGEVVAEGVDVDAAAGGANKGFGAEAAGFEASAEDELGKENKPGAAVFVSSWASVGFVTIIVGIVVAAAVAEAAASSFAFFSFSILSFSAFSLSTRSRSILSFSAFSRSALSFSSLSFASFSACFLRLASLILEMPFASSSCFSNFENVRYAPRGLPLVLSDSPGDAEIL
jgi:hypothetical protein